MLREDKTIYGSNNDGMDVEAKVDGQHQARLDREGIIGCGDTRTSCMEATNPKHRHHTKWSRCYDANDVCRNVCTCVCASLLKFFLN